MFGSEQSCIGEPLMRKECVSGFIGGKQSIELAVAEYHERMVMKAVAVIVHVGASNEEGGKVLNASLIYQKEGFGGRGVVYDTYEWEL
jgi:hypothetical protein